jgi:hypothetical protein
VLNESLLVKKQLAELVGASIFRRVFVEFVFICHSIYISPSQTEQDLAPAGTFPVVARGSKSLFSPLFFINQLQFLQEL